MVCKRVVMPIMNNVIDVVRFRICFCVAVSIVWFVVFVAMSPNMRAKIGYDARIGATTESGALDIAYIERIIAIADASFAVK